MKRFAPFALALLLDLVGAVGALLVSTRHWQQISTPRPPQAPAVLAVSGHTLDSGPLALGLVALAGVVAVIATRGITRRVVGVVIALAGAGLIWRSAVAAGAVGADRARSLVAHHLKTVSRNSRVTPHVSVHLVWPVLSIACGVLVLVAGVLIAWRGQHWQVMSARYEAAPAADVDPDSPKARAAIWNALDRGEDPTER